MNASSIKPGQYYRAVDIYEKEVIKVLAVEPSKTVHDHWLCRRPDGRKVILPTTVFVRHMPTK